MSAPILATKLYVPRPRPNVILRSRLIERLNEGLQRTPGVILISASAGFGKTTLVSEWVNQKAEGGRRKDESEEAVLHPSAFIPHPSKAAWLSLDEGDNDPVRFLTYLIAAVQTIAPKIGEGLSAALQSPQPPPTEAILTALLNEITTVSDNLILVLDDYHVVDSRSVDQVLTFLVEHLPPQLHLVIATREDPPLPLARLRVRGQLTELRATDLRFTPVEAAEFLNRVMGLNLSAEDIAALENRTEGWIAGLQLAAISLQGRSDVAGFIGSFTGSHRFVLDYLVEEVLQHQPEHIRSFLLQTVMLDRFCAPLCNAVTEREDSKDVLDVLERGNLFLIPLDDQRQWYRYHHLFADVLQTRLMEAQPDRVVILHSRASEWYERNGLRSDAIRHALAAEDFARAADLIELIMPAMNRARQFATLLGWLKTLPDELIRVRPMLSIGYAMVSISCGEFGSVEPRLRDAERWLNTTANIHERPESPAAEMIVADEREFHRLPGLIALIRAGQALGRGDMPATVKYARRVLDLAPEGDHLMLGGAASQLGLVAWTSGDLDTARRMTADGMANLQLAGYVSPAIGCAITLADIQIAQGRLLEAMTTYERGLQRATQSGAPVLPGAADMYVGMSNLHYEHNDLKVATQYLLTSQALGELAGLPQNPYRWRAAMARTRVAQGDLDGALNLLDQAERLYDGNFSPNVRPIATRKVRVWVAQGRLGEAMDWAREQGLSVENELSYLREFDHITLARVLLARYQSDRADGSISGVVGLLDRLLKAAEEGGRLGSVLEILVLQALAYHTQRDLPAALLPLQHALALAEPEGYARMFLDEGEPMRLLILDFRMWIEKRAREGHKPIGYVDKLLAAFLQPATMPQTKISNPTPLRSGDYSQQSAILEPLSERELEILKLIAQGLSNREISARLFLALDTVKGHNRRIFDKLQVQRRTEAIARARELGLL
jgi:LuxR family transcriptional regulator, maltose regulon positive regulatory protein